MGERESQMVMQCV